MKGILPALLKAAGLAYPVSVLFNLLLFRFNGPFNARDFEMMGMLLLVGSVYIIVVLLILSLPALFLRDIIWWEKPALRVTLYFGGPLVFTCGVFIACISSDSGDAIAFSSIGVVYLIFHTIFYKKLVRKRQELVTDAH